MLRSASLGLMALILTMTAIAPPAQAGSFCGYIESSLAVRRADVQYVFKLVETELQSTGAEDLAAFVTRNRRKIYEAATSVCGADASCDPAGFKLAVDAVIRQNESEIAAGGRKIILTEQKLREVIQNTPLRKLDGNYFFSGNALMATMSLVLGFKFYQAFTQGHWDQIGSRAIIQAFLAGTLVSNVVGGMRSTWGNLRMLWKRASQSVRLRRGLRRAVNEIDLLPFSDESMFRAWLETVEMEIRENAGFEPNYAAEDLVSEYENGANWTLVEQDAIREMLRRQYPTYDEKQGFLSAIEETCVRHAIVDHSEIVRTFRTLLGL